MSETPSTPTDSPEDAVAAEETGVAATTTDEGTTFEPEEDPEGAAE